MKNLKILGILLFSTCMTATTESFANPKNETEMVKSVDIIPIATPVVTLEQAKAQLRLEADFADDDAMIVQMVAASQAWAHEYIGRPLAYTLELELNSFADAVEMTCLPEASLTGVEYISDAETGAYTELPADNYKFRQDFTAANTYNLTFKGELPVLPPDNNRAVRVVMTAACPEPVRSAILLRLSDLYERREDRVSQEKDLASVSLCRPYKVAW